MGCRAALFSVIRAVSRPYLIIPAAFVAALVLLSPPAIDDASAQGFRMQSSRGGFSGGGPGRFSMMPGGMSNGMMKKSGRPGGSASNAPVPEGWHGHGWDRRGRASVRRNDRQSGTVRKAITAIRAGRAVRVYVPPTRGRRAAVDRRLVRRPTSVAAAGRRRRRPRNPTAAARQLGAATCRTRWWSRSRPTSRRRPSTRCCGGIA